MEHVARSQYLPFLEAAEESALLARAAVKSLAPGDIVFDQGIPLRAMFFIEEGQVRVERLDRGAMIPLASLGPGEFFGEMSFVDGAPTSARVVAEEPTRLRIVDVSTVDKHGSSDPGFTARWYRSIAVILAARLRLTSSRLYLDQSWG